MDCSLAGSLSMEFFRQECWSGLPFPPPGDLSNPEIETASPALAGGLFIAPPYGQLLPMPVLPILKPYQTMSHANSLLGESLESNLTFILHSRAGGKVETFRGSLCLVSEFSPRSTELTLEVDLQATCMWTLHGVHFCLRPTLTSIGYNELNDMWGAKQSAKLPPICKQGHWGSKSGSKMSTVTTWDTAAVENHKDFSLSPVLGLCYFICPLGAF